MEGNLAPCEHSGIDDMEEHQVGGPHMSWRSHRAKVVNLACCHRSIQGCGIQPDMEEGSTWPLWLDDPKP